MTHSDQLDAPSPARRFLPILFLLLAFIAAAGAFLSLRAALSARDAAAALAPDPGLESLVIPPFLLVDHTGAEATRDIFLGRVTILDFIFTNCPFACPLMAARMLEAQERLEGTGVRFISVTVDPQRDTPERLRDYAAEIGADLDSWTFLTGDANVIRDWIRDGMLLNLEDDPARQIELPDGSTMPNIIHPTHLILVGPDARILGLFGSTMPEQQQALIDRARRVARAAAKESIGN